MKWTPEQDLILRIHGHRGPEYCRNLIFKTFGIYRSVTATQRRASRIKAPLIRYEICPECGRIERRLNRNTGLCDACNYERLWREQVEEEQRILEQLNKGGETNGITKAKRQYDAQRQKVSRLRRRNGNSVDMSRKKSNPRSGPEKTLRESSMDRKKPVRASA